MAATPEGNALSRQEQHKMCRSKKRYRNESEAIDAVIRAQRRGQASRGRVYRCQICAGYHVSPAPKH